MNKIIRIIIVVILLPFLASCKNSVTEEKCPILAVSTGTVSSIPLKSANSEEAVKSYAEEYSYITEKESNNFTKKQDINTLEDKEPQNYHAEYQKEYKVPIPQFLPKAETTSSKTSEHVSREITDTTSQLQTLNKEVLAEGDENSKSNLNEWLDTFVKGEENTQEDIIAEKYDTNDIAENAPDLNSEEAAAVDALDSSCLPSPIVGITDSDSSSFADKFIIKTPEEKPAGEEGIRRVAHKAMGKALPTSLKDTDELIIKVSKEKADIIEKLKNEGINFDAIINEIGLSNLIENNTVEDIVKLNIPYSQDEDIVYKIVLRYSLNSLEPDNETTVNFEPNYFIEDLAMEANSFIDDILNQLKVNLWYREESRRWDAKSGNTSTAGAGIIVAVIDTGIDYTLEKLNGVIWENINEVPDNGIDDDNNGYIDDIQGRNFVDNNNDIMDYDGHGTHVAGIVTLVSGACRIMPVKALTREGGRTLDLYSAIRYAVDNGAKVINLSWGGDTKSEIINNVIDYAYSHNCVIVAAAGNSYMDEVLEPAGNHKVISVMGSNMYGNITNFTNRGADILAPGKDIFSYSTGKGVEMEYKSGTSMAAPFVSGAAAQLLSLEPKMHPMEVFYNLKYEAENYNNGRLNIAVKTMPVKGIMCRILSAIQQDNKVNITAVAKNSGIENYLFSVDYAEGMNPGKDIGMWKNISKVYKNVITEDEKFIWDVTGLPSGAYTIRLSGAEYRVINGKIELKGSVGIVDKFTIEITGQEDTEINDSIFLWRPFCKVNKSLGAYIEVSNPLGNNIQITPVFYNMNNRLGGYEIRSSLASVINEKGNYIIDLKRYLPDTITDYEGPVGLEVSNYSKDTKIFLKLIDEDSGIIYSKEQFAVKSDSLDEIGASWNPYVPSKQEREGWRNDYKNWLKKVDAEKDYDLKNNPNVPRLKKDARLVLYNPTYEDASVNITFFADGKLFDTGYNKNIQPWFWTDFIGGEYSFFKIRGTPQFPVELFSINDMREINFKLANHRKETLVTPYLHYAHIDGMFMYFTSITKLGTQRDDGLYEIKWSSVTLAGSINIPARAYISIPTWSFMEGPIYYYCANACVVNNIFPKGSVEGAVIQLNNTGTAEEVIPLDVFAENPPSLN